jgi:hypothetical protein
VIGVEICGSLKNVLAIAAGIVEGLELGPNAMAALVAQVPSRCPAASASYCVLLRFCKGICRLAAPALLQSPLL